MSIELRQGRRLVEDAERLVLLEMALDGGFEDLHGLSAFCKDAAGSIFHTYSTHACGCDILVGAYNFLDLAPKGRDEDGLSFTMEWVRHHDRYGG